MFNIKSEDALLRAQVGPVWLICLHGVVSGLEITHTGPMSAYEPYEQIADKLVKDGLLTKGHTRGCAGSAYSFTKRGQIAHWAIGEAAIREQEKRLGLR